MMMERQAKVYSPQNIFSCFATLQHPPTQLGYIAFTAGHCETFFICPYEHIHMIDLNMLLSAAADNIMAILWSLKLYYSASYMTSYITAYMISGDGYTSGSHEDTEACTL